MRRRLAAVVLSAAALLVGAACSGDDESAAPTTSSTSSTSSTTTTSAPTTTSTTLLPVAPAAAADPAGLAEQAAQAEKAIRDPAVSGEALLRAGWTQQVVARTVAQASAQVQADVLRRVPAEYRTTVEANIRAAAELRALTPPGQKPPDHWRVVAPSPPETLLQYYKAAEAEVGVPWQYLASVHFVETKFSRIRGTSTAGAQGPMQFLPSTWRQYGGGGDINNERDAIFAAARMLKRNGAPERIDDALFNYNRSRRYVAAIKLYAEQMAASDRQFRAYHQWQVYYRTTAGDLVLLEGFPDVPAIRG